MLGVVAFVLSGCLDDPSFQESQTVAEQQKQYLISQPVPVFDWSLERQLVIELYKLRNEKVTTHSVWRSDYGMIEGDCPSMGYGIPYDTSLTNPLQKVLGYEAVVEQPEPNGVFASKNTTATWVMCIDTDKPGALLPVYVESKVTVYPYPVKVDYDKNRVYRAGKPSTNFSIDGGD